MTRCPLKNARLEASYKRDAGAPSFDYYNAAPEWLSMPKVCRILSDHNEGCPEQMGDFIGEHGIHDLYHRSAVYTYLGY